jgi:hypothetical protein
MYNLMSFATSVLQQTLGWMLVALPCGLVCSMALLAGFRLHTFESSTEARRILLLLTDRVLLSWHLTVHNGTSIPRGPVLGMWFLAWGPMEARRGGLTILCHRRYLKALLATSSSQAQHVTVYGDVQETDFYSYIGPIAEWVVTEKATCRQEACISRILSSEACRVHVLLGNPGCGKSTVAKLLAVRLRARLIRTSRDVAAVFTCTEPGPQHPVVWMVDEFDLAMRGKQHFNETVDFVNNSRHLWMVLTSNKTRDQLLGMEPTNSPSPSPNLALRSVTAPDQLQPEKKSEGFDASCFREGRVLVHGWFEVESHALCP